MNIWIFQTGEPLHIDSGNPRPMRAMSLANILNAQGHLVTIWSSAFYHQEKKHRVLKYKKIRFNELLEIRLIPSPGYNNNFGIKRLYDHVVLAVNLKKILKHETSIPDVAFIGYPPIEFAYVAQKWLAKKNVPTMLDIKDLWPEIFTFFLPKSIKILGKIFLFPYFYLAKKVITDTTAVTSMTDAFLNYTISSFGRNRSKIDLAFPFSAQRIKVTEEELNISKNWWYNYKLNQDSVFRISYIGNISSNIDLVPIMEAAIYFDQKFKEIEFVICGDGPLLEDYKKKFAKIKSVKFIGRVNHLQAAALSDIAQATLIPYKNSKDFQLSLPNKFIDGLSYGLPILSSLSGEVAKMINKYNIGISYGKPFNRSLIDAINILLNNNLLNEIAGNCRNVYEKNFTYKKVYKNLSNHLTKIRLKV